MRLLRGESLDALARECKQPAGVISGWREEFPPSAGSSASPARRPASIEGAGVRVEVIGPSESAARSER